MEEEVWKDVVGYEGSYQVSNFGVVKSVDRTILIGKISTRYYGKIIKQGYTKRGYRRVHLSKDNISCHMSVHRLVAMAFIPNPENKPEVNHKNGIKHDNNVCNLEWVTRKENEIHSFRILGKKSNGSFGHLRGDGHRSKLAYKRDIEYNIIQTYLCAKDASDEMGVCYSLLCRWCRNEEERMGYIWSY